MGWWHPRGIERDTPVDWRVCRSPPGRREDYPSRAASRQRTHRRLRFQPSDVARARPATGSLAACGPRRPATSAIGASARVARAIPWQGLLVNRRARQARPAFANSAAGAWRFLANPAAAIPRALTAFACGARARRSAASTRRLA